MSAARIVRNDREKPRSSDDRIVLPAPHLVFQAFEVDDVGVDGDADRHDDAGHAGQREGQPVRSPSQHVSA